MLVSLTCSNGNGRAKSWLNRQPQWSVRQVSLRARPVAWTTRRATPTANTVGVLAPEQALKVGPHRDRMRDAVGATGGEGAGEVAATAVADQRDATAVGPPQPLDSPLHPVERAVRATGIGDEAAELEAGSRGAAATPR